MKVQLIFKQEKNFNGLFQYAHSLTNTLLKEKRLDIKIVNMYGAIPKIFKFLLNNRKNSYEITHFLDQTVALPLFFKNCKGSIVTVHDLTFLAKPHLWAEAKYLRLGAFDKLIYSISIKSLQKAERIITVSEHTKKDLVKYVGYPANKIDVIYEGVDKKFKCSSHPPRERLNILYVGAEVPTKNLSTLFLAFAILKKKLPQTKLIKVGSPKWPGDRDKLAKLANNLQIDKDVIFRNYVEDIVKEYNNADLFVFPSLYEGFGLPVLEAMACGCPVISSNSSSLPEVGGNAVLYFNPSDAEELAEKMYQVLTDEKLRKSLIKKGLKRAKQFTWEKTAKKTIQTYKKVSKS